MKRKKKEKRERKGERDTCTYNYTRIYIHIYVQTLGNIAVCEKIPSVLLTRFYEKKRLTLEKNSSRYGRCYTADTCAIHVEEKEEEEVVVQAAEKTCVLNEYSMSSQAVKKT